MSPGAYLLALPVRAYRLVLSPYVGHGCRFQPTCSAYALGALEQHGALRGSGRRPGDIVGAQWYLPKGTGTDVLGYWRPEQGKTMIANDTTRVIDASSAHRVAQGWTYGFPEMAQGQAGRIAGAAKVANPGCYPTGAIGLLRPLEGHLDVGVHMPTVIMVAGVNGAGKTTDRKSVV